MAQEIIKMSKKELKRLKLVHMVMNKRLKQKVAAKKLSLSTRHFRRIIKKVRTKGDTAVIHGNRGQPSNRKYSDELKTKVTEIIKNNYWDFGPTFIVRYS